ncbi:hypothetical protein FAZ69_12400 [Trinickia terrae]|uniref:Uncharacterized protein n=1 Tax=Trinickia terrae TaxID=2571161 RepID=A0A4U1I8D0_9BURK|nr:hypothetical protein [Trinickia terrae]TKC89711.1 hypothetical protein FAZ69_12400 [Trinickia terrae]
MDSQPIKPETAQAPAKKKGPSKRTLNVLSFLVGIVTFAIGVAWLIYAELPIFAIPLVVCVPVIAAVAFRNCWD